MNNIIRIIIFFTFFINNINTADLSYNKYISIRNTLNLTSVQGKNDRNVEADFKKILEKEKIKVRLKYFDQLLTKKTKTKKKKKKSKKEPVGINYIKYLRYKEGNNIDFNREDISITALLSKEKRFKKTKVSDDYKSRIKQRIEKQSGIKYNEIGEFIGNVLDLYGMDIGKFGMGFKQGFKGMKEGDVLEVLSKVKGSDHFVRLRIYVKKNFQKEELYIEDEIIKTEKKDYHGTRVKVIKKEKQNKEEIKKYIRNKFKYVKDDKVNIYIYDEELKKIEKVNEEEGLKILDEEVVEKKDGKNVYIVVNKNGYEVIDEGKGMTRKIMLDNLISLKQSTKSMIKKQKKAQLKYAIRDELSNKKKKGKITLTVQGVTIEQYDIEGYNICEELAIELGQADLGYSRDTIIMNDKFYKTLNIFIDKLILKTEIKIEDKIKIYNTILELFKQKKKWDEHEVNLLKTRIMEDVKTMKLYGKVLLPSLNDIELLKLRIKPSRIIYVNEEIYPEGGIEVLERHGLEKVENFKSDKGYKLYLVDFAQREKIKISIGKVIILNKSIYENNDKKLLNLYLNYWIGYGKKPPQKGLIEEDQKEKPKDLKYIKEEDSNKIKYKEKEEEKEKEKEKEKKKNKKQNNKKFENKKKEEEYQAYMKPKNLDRLNNITKDTKKEILRKIYDYIDIQEEKKVNDEQIKDIINNFLDQVLFLLSQNIDIGMILPNLKILKNKSNVKYIELKKRDSKLRKFYLSDKDGNVISDDYTYIAPVGSDWIYAYNALQGGKYDYFIFRVGRRNVEKLDIGVDFSETKLKVIGEDIWIVVQDENLVGWYIIKNKKIYTISKEVQKLTQTQLGNNLFLRVEVNGKWLILKNGKRVDDNLYDIIKNLNSVGNDLWATGIQNNKHFLLKNGKKVNNEGYDEIKSFIPIGNNKLSVGIQNNKYFLLKNGKKVNNEVYDKLEEYSIIGKDIYIVFKKNNKYYLFKNEKKVNQSGFVSIDKLKKVGDKLITTYGPRKKIIYDGVLLERETIIINEEKREVDFVEYIKAGNSSWKIVRDVGNSKFSILENEKMINNDEYDEIRNLGVIGDNFFAIGKIGYNNYILKNGKKMNKDDLYIVIKDINIIGNDIWITVRTDKNKEYLLKNGSIKAGLNKEYKEMKYVEVVDKALWTFARDSDRKWHILKNGKKVNEDIYDFVLDVIVLGDDVWAKVSINGEIYFVKNGELVYPNDENKKGFNEVYKARRKIVGNDFWTICRQNKKYFLVKNGRIQRELVGVIVEYEIEAYLLYDNTLDINVRKFNKKQKEKLEKIINKNKNNEFLVKKIVNYYLHDLDELFYEYEFMQEGLEYIEPSEYNKILNVLNKFKNQLNMKEIEGILFKKTKLEKEAYYRFLLKIVENKEKMDNKTFFQYFTRLNDFMRIMQEQELEDLILKKGLYNYIFEEEGSIPEDLVDYVKFFQKENLNIIKTKEYEDFEYDKSGQLTELLASNESKSKFKKLSFSLKKMKKTNKKENKRKQEDIRRKLVRTIEGQKVNESIFIRELTQNSVDAGTKKVDINEYVRNNGNVQEHVLEFNDYVGMDKKILLEKLLMPESSGKRLDKGSIGGFGIGFYTVFQYSNVVEIETEKDGKMTVIRLELKEDEKTQAKYIEYKMLSFSINKRNKRNHTSIRLIKKYDTTTKMKHTLEYFTRKRIIRKMIGGNVIGKNKIWEKENIKSKDKKDVIIKYNGENVISKDKKRTLLSEVQMKNPKGELKIYLNPVHISNIEKDGLYINEIQDEWFKEVPTVILDSLKKYMNRLVIEFPSSTQMTLARHDISDDKEKKEIKKAIAIGLIRALINLKLYRGERIIGLSEDSLYTEKGIEKDIIKDAKNINSGNWQNLGFKNYKDNRRSAIKLLFLLKPNEKSESLYEIRTKRNKVRAKNYHKEMLEQMEKAKERIKLRNKSRKTLKIEGNEVLENVKYFLLGLKGITGIGFEEIEFYESDNGVDAECEKLKNVYKLHLNYTYLKEDFENINRAFKNNESIENVIFSLKGEIFFETLLHEATHRREWIKYQDEGIESSTQWTHQVDEGDEGSFSSMMEQLIEQLLLAKIKDTREIIEYGNMISDFQKLDDKIDFEKIIEIFIKRMDIVFKRKREKEEFKSYGVDKLRYLLKSA
jgi:hypothetical protein